MLEARLVVATPLEVDTLRSVHRNSRFFPPTSMLLRVSLLAHDSLALTRCHLASSQVLCVCVRESKSDQRDDLRSTPPGSRNSSYEPGMQLLQHPVILLH